eukprot:g11943.t1
MLTQNRHVCEDFRALFLATASVHRKGWQRSPVHARGGEEGEASGGSFHSNNEWWSYMVTYSRDAIVDEKWEAQVGPRAAQANSQYDGDVLKFACELYKTAWGDQTSSTSPDTEVARHFGEGLAALAEYRAKSEAEKAELSLAERSHLLTDGRRLVDVARKHVARTKALFEAETQVGAGEDNNDEDYNNQGREQTRSEDRSSFLRKQLLVQWFLFLEEASWFTFLAVSDDAKVQGGVYVQSAGDRLNQVTAIRDQLEIAFDAGFCGFRFEAVRHLVENELGNEIRKHNYPPGTETGETPLSAIVKHGTGILTTGAIKENVDATGEDERSDPPAGRVGALDLGTLRRAASHAPGAWGDAFLEAQTTRRSPERFAVAESGVKQGVRFDAEALL